MDKRRWFALLLVVIIVVMTFFAANSRLAASDDSPTGLNAKLDRVLNNQEQILKKLDDITAELKIVKIRATR
jgi:peptidoglycan hydrolase CwlO-like protein